MQNLCIFQQSIFIYDGERSNRPSIKINADMANKNTVTIVVMLTTTRVNIFY